MKKKPTLPPKKILTPEERKEIRDRWIKRIGIALGVLTLTWCTLHFKGFKERQDAFKAMCRSFHKGQSVFEITEQAGILNILFEPDPEPDLRLDYTWHVLRPDFTWPYSYGCWVQVRSAVVIGMGNRY